MTPPTKSPSETAGNLILALNILIKQNGGNEKFARMIESEWPLAPRKRERIPYQYTIENLWTKDEIRILKDNVNKIRFREIAKLVNRSEAATWQKAKGLGLKIVKFNRWH